MAGATGYRSAKNVKHSEMEDAFMNFASDTAARYAVFTEMMTKNVNLSTQSRQQEDKIQVFQAELCNLKVVSATQTVYGKINKSGQPYAQEKNKNHSGKHIQLIRNITTIITVGLTGTAPVTHTRPKHARRQTWDT